MARRRKTRIRPPGATTRSRVLIFLESIQSEVKANSESIVASEQRLRNEFNARFDRIELRLDAVEAAVRQNSADIHALEHRMTLLEGRMGLLERRVSRIELHLGLPLLA